MSNNSLHEYLASQQIKSFRLTRGSFEKGRVHIEYALLLQKIHGSSTDYVPDYVRVGIAREHREWIVNYGGTVLSQDMVDAAVSDYNTWDYRPSVFETGAVEETIRIL